MNHAPQHHKRIRIPVAAALAVALCVFGGANFAHAANSCTSTGTGNWSAPATWTTCGGVIPTAADTVTILSGHIITVDTIAVASTTTINANAAVGGNGISINAGRSLTVTGAVTLNIPTAATTDVNVNTGALTAGSIAIPGSATANRFATVSVSTGTVNVLGSITFSGTAARARYTSTGASVTNIGGDFGAGGTLTTTGTGTFNFNGSVPQIINAYATYNNIQISNTAGNVSFGTTTSSLSGTLLITTGTLDVGPVNLTVTGTTTVNSTLQISSVTGTKSFGDITVASGGNMSFTAAEAVTENGNLAVNGTGTITGATGLWTFARAGGGVLEGTATSTQTLGSATFTTNYVSSIPLTVTAATTVNPGITLTNSSIFTATGALAGVTGTFAQSSGARLNIGLTSLIGTLDASASPNEVHYAGAAAQVVHAGTYHHLFIEKPGAGAAAVATSGGTVTINGDVRVVQGALADGGNQITGNASGLFRLASSTTLTLGTVATSTAFPTSFTSPHISLQAASTVDYSSNQPQTISDVPSYGNLTLTATAAVAKTAAGNLTINGNLTNGVNNTLADGGFVLTVKGNSTMTGTHTGTGKILFASGTASHNVAGTGSYNNLELNDTNGASQTGTVNIIGAFTLTNGTWTTNANTLTVTGDTSVLSTLAITSTIGTKTFGNLTIHSGAVMNFTAAEAVTENGNLTIDGTGVITGTTGIWTFQKIGGGTIAGNAPSITIPGATTFATVYALPSIFTVNTMTANAGVNETNAGTVTINTSLAGTGTFTQGASTVLNLGGGTTVATLDASTSPNDVHYTSTTTAQTVKQATYDNLFIEKLAQVATVSGTTNVLGNLRVTSGVLSLGGSVLTVTGSTDILGTLRDVNNTGSATFAGSVTVESGGSWDGNVGEACNFNFENGFSFSGTSFITGAGLYTFDTNNQSITGSSPISVANLVVNGIQLTNTSLAPLTVATDLSGTGELIQGTGAVLDVGGTASISTLTALAPGNAVRYIGATAQTAKPVVYRTLDVSANAANNVTISGDTTADTSLTLGNTILSTASSTMSLGNGATLSRGGGFVNGNLQKHVSSTTPSQSFEIGSGVTYAPVDLSFNAVTVAGDVLANTTPSDHASIATSHILSNFTANRFFSLFNHGVSFLTYDGTFTFDPADVDPGADTGTFVLAKFDPGTWTRPNVIAVTPTSVSATGLTSMSDFQIGTPDIVASTLIDTAHADGTFAAGEIIDITVQYNDVVTVAGGTPSVDLNSGGTAFYVSGSGTNTLAFRYTVLTGENSPDLDYTSVAALSLNGATISDSGGGATDNTLPSAGTFAAAHAIVIDTTPPAALHIVTLVSNLHGGTAVSEDFTLHVQEAGVDVALSPTAGTTTPGTLYTLRPGTYVVSEDAHVGYVQSVSGDCDGGGSVTLISSDDRTCTITNTDIPAALHVIKLVVNNNGGTATSSDFNVHVENGGVDVGGSPSAGAATPGTFYTLSAGTYVVSEDANFSYSASFSGACNASGSVTLALGSDQTCTITNTDIPATLHVIKLVVNSSIGTASSSDFILHVQNNGVDVAGSPAAGTTTPGTLYSLSAGTYVVSEDANAAYTENINGACDADGTVALLPGDSKTCLVTNTDISPPLPPPPVPADNPQAPTAPGSIGIFVQPSLVSTEASALTASPGLPNTGGPLTSAPGFPNTGSPSVTPLYVFYRSLSFGDSGADVVVLQAILVEKGFLTIPPNVVFGYFGSLSSAAIVKYQSSAGLSPVGVFGPLTRAKLNAELAL